MPLLRAIFSRRLIVFVYWTITLIVTVQMMLQLSFVVGAAALVACALCFASVSTVVGSVLARRQKKYRATDLIGIGAIGLVLLVAGLALMIWSQFYLLFYGVEISGLEWALLAAAVGAVVVRRQDAVNGRATWTSEQ
jgi:drug/metabolite transporter (DMT)-like permease